MPKVFVRTIPYSLPTQFEVDGDGSAGTYSWPTQYTLSGEDNPTQWLGMMEDPAQILLANQLPPVYQDPMECSAMDPLLQTL